MPTVNKDASVQDVLSAPIPSTGCVSAPIKALRNIKTRLIRLKHLKRRKKRMRRQIMSKNNKLCPMNKLKTKLPKLKDTVEKTSVIKTYLANTCKYPKSVTLIQEVVDHITQLVYAGSIFANLYSLELLENDKELPVVTQNPFNSIFSIFIGQEKHASDNIKKSYKAFCEFTSLSQSDLEKYANKGYMTIVSSMAKKYETLVCNYVCSTYEDRALRHILNVLSEKASSYFCGDSLTVKQRKSLAKHPSTIDRIEQYETIVNNFLTFWSMYDASNDADKEMEQKNFVQELKHQDKASSSYVHRKLQELPFVKKLNTSKYISLKENTLTAINSNKPLEITSRLKNIDKRDIDAVQSFIKTVQARIQDKTFMPLKYTKSRGSRYFSLFSLYRIDSKNQTRSKNDNYLTLWYFNVFDFSKIGYKTLDSLTSRPKKLVNVITTNGYAVSFMFKKVVAIHDEPRREPKTPKDFADIADDTEIWAVDPDISATFTAVDSTEHALI
ncbi:uncharacterized protein RHIMIDRAFT_244703 [Rhizopus microsporus ATCC 52813]|uniref:Uncharacterized protein n=1 Tax=Rhizopus microsporus ATCC 52813 TaxID=1340429 RepID=A0A2G4SPW8_RHIZD|nr:uncharacterized protein RHIMIDRAFT_244703 [Rhizopus microsporus ATCC 52813]PHZ10819.1 hypothetical protein RHIMIDRAFT_244703 [Rhizopus microsporus ATCC 52813]